MLPAQEFRIGFLAGTPITSNVVPATSASSGSAFFPPYVFTTETGARSFIAGLTLEAILNSRFSIEADALHRDYRAKEILTLNPGSSSATTTTNQFVISTTWEFPVLLKYTIGTNRWQPFVDAGMSFRSFERTSVLDPSRYGYTAGAGLAIALGRIQLTPQLRYTRWALQSHLNGNYEFKQDQLELLTGVSFRMPATLKKGSRQFAVGLLGGLRLNETLVGAPYRLGKRVFGGASLDVNIGHQFSMEADGIYEPIGNTGNSVITWDFPVLLKYHRALRGLPLFGEAGPSFRASGNLQGSVAPSVFGFTAGVGIEKHAKGILLAPAFRYTRWAAGQGDNGSSGTTIYRPNSAELLLGLSF